MRGLHKPKRISWASDVNLCQVKLFLLEESPSQIGLSSQDHLQAKASWLPHSSGAGSDDNLPPGFEGGYPADQPLIDVSQIPLVKWKFPPRVVLDLTWAVVCGEESKEAEIQNERERRVLEAVYPRPSAIPENPSVMADAEDSFRNDVEPPMIPITAIEDEDAGADSSSESMVPFNVPASSQSFLPIQGNAAPSQSNGPNNRNHIPSYQPAAGTPIGVEPDVVAAAYGAIATSNEQGNMIDHELLIKILSNPKMIEKLATDPQPMTRPPQMPLSGPPAVHINRTESSTPSSTSLASAHFYPQPNVGGMGRFPGARPPPPPAIPGPPPPSVGPPPSKDINYYKSLIQQHGGDRQETYPPFGNHHGSDHPIINHEPSNGYRLRDSKPKIMKPCMYFNSPRGCRNGSNCAFQHDPSYQPPRGGGVPEAHSAKRMKMDREISS